MVRSWSIGRKIAVGFGAVVALAVVSASIGVYGLRRVVAEEERLVSVNAQKLLETQELHAAFERKIAEVRGFFFARDDHFLALMRAARGDFLEILRHLKQQASTEEGKRRLADIEKAEAEHQDGLDRAISMLKSKENAEAVVELMRRDLAPKREQLYQRLSEFVDTEERYSGRRRPLQRATPPRRRRWHWARPSPRSSSRQRSQSCSRA